MRLCVLGLTVRGDAVVAFLVRCEKMRWTGVVWCCVVSCGRVACSLVRACLFAVFVMFVIGCLVVGQSGSQCILFDPPFDGRSTTHDDFDASEL